jgi:hypothetical protein
MRGDETKREITTVWFERNKFTCFHDRLIDGSIKENINDAGQDEDNNHELFVLLNLIIKFPYLCFGKSHLIILICSFKMLNLVLINNSLLFIILKQNVIPV